MMITCCVCNQEFERLATRKCGKCQAIEQAVEKAKQLEMVTCAAARPCYQCGMFGYSETGKGEGEETSWSCNACLNPVTAVQILNSKNARKASDANGLPPRPTIKILVSIALGIKRAFTWNALIPPVRAQWDWTFDYTLQRAWSTVMQELEPCTKPLFARFVFTFACHDAYLRGIL